MAFSANQNSVVTKFQNKNICSMQNALRNQIFTWNNLKHCCPYLNECVFTDYENTNICLVTLAPWVHHLSRDIYFSIFLWSVHSHNPELNFTVIFQVSHYFHSLCPRRITELQSTPFWFYVAITIEMIVWPEPGTARGGGSTASTDGAKEAGFRHRCCCSFCLTSHCLKVFDIKMEFLPDALLSLGKASKKKSTFFRK